MIVLSLFDGISAGRVALDRAGIPVERYYRAEIDKYATQVAHNNYPDSSDLGDVLNWREWDIDWSSVDLLIGGSPCQGFSFAGKQLAFDDPRSRLFFVFHEILYHIYTCNPRVKYMLENVKMKKEHLDVITSRLGVSPVLINSALVSAQNRQRYYWYNWKCEQPDDKGIVLRDIIDDSLNLAESIRPCNRIKEGDVGHIAETSDIKGMDCIKRVYGQGGKAPTLTTMGGGHREPKLAVTDTLYRKLSPLECERLQTFPDNYTAGVSNTQRYKSLGNSWTVDVIAHIFSALPRE